ncbi:MAG: DUF2283 domain-containing protein [Cyanobacteria bacterium J06634_5]
MEIAQLLNPNLQMQWDYDPNADVLYMSVGEPQPALGVDIGEGLVLRYSETQSAIVGLTVIGLKSRLEQTQEDMPMTTNIHQYGKGDNIAGDKVLGDKIQTQINNNPDLAQAARDIKALLNELSEEYNPTTAKGQSKIKDGALAQIRQNPQIKQRTLKALKSAGEEALEQAIQHPVAKVVVEGVKSFLEG